jgi:hypothetical protein
LTESAQDVKVGDQIGSQRVVAVADSGYFVAPVVVPRSDDMFDGGRVNYDRVEFVRQT